MEEVLRPLINTYKNRLILINSKTTYKTILNTSNAQSVTTLKYKDHKIVIKYNFGASRSVEIKSFLPKQEEYSRFLLKTKWSLLIWFTKHSLQITGDTPRFVQKIKALPAIQILNKCIRSTGLKPIICGYHSGEYFSIVTKSQITNQNPDKIILSTLEFYFDFIELIEIKNQKS